MLYLGYYKKFGLWANSSVQEDEVGEMVWVQGQLMVPRQFRVSLRYRAEPCLREERNQSTTQTQAEAYTVPRALASVALLFGASLGCWQANLWKNVYVILGGVWFKSQPPQSLLLLCVWYVVMVELQLLTGKMHAICRLTLSYVGTFNNFWCGVSAPAFCLSLIWVKTSLVLPLGRLCFYHLARMWSSWW